MVGELQKICITQVWCKWNNKREPAESNRHLLEHNYTGLTDSTPSAWLLRNRRRVPVSRDARQPNRCVISVHTHAAVESYAIKRILFGAYAIRHTILPLNMVITKNVFYGYPNRSRRLAQLLFIPWFYLDHRKVILRHYCHYNSVKVSERIETWLTKRFISFQFIRYATSWIR